MFRVAVVMLALVRIAVACPVGKQIAAAHGAPNVDGELDDEVWRDACWVTDFEQKTPTYGAKPSHPIKVAVAIRGNTLYVAARMWSAGIADVDDALTARDDTDGAERFIVSLDPTHTRRIAYSFAVTAAGVRADWIHTDDTEGNRDLSWDPVWTGKAKVLADGWSMEMAIPLTQLRLPRVPAQSWGINFDWYLPRKNEDVFWRAVPKDVQAWASHFGELVDLPPLESHVSLELLPYISVRGSVDEARAAYPEHRLLGGFEAGLDAKVRPLPGLVINATINPDFGQVEADPAFVNLTAFEVTLEEKRPFFVENNAAFHNYEENVFYSRRIGGLPTRLPAYDSIALPPSVRILGAAALGGYIEEHTQIAAITAVTDEAKADAIVDGRRQELTVSPLTFWAATHVEHQLNDSSTATFQGTLVERALGGTNLAQLLNQTAFYTGANTVLRTDDGTWELFLFGGMSGVFGTPASIQTIEESSAHYYQRPDQHYLKLDGADHLLGYDAGAWVTKRSGAWTGAYNLTVESPGLELNDIGVIHQADSVAVYTELIRNETEPTKHIYAWDGGVFFDTEWMLDGRHKPFEIGAKGGVTFPNFWSVSINANVDLPGIYPDTTRGGPDLHIDRFEYVTFGVSSPSGRKHSIGASLQLQQSATWDNGVIASITGATRITPALRLDLAPTLTWLENKRQYVATVTDAGGGEDTYGARYIFGHLHRHEAALQLRATWSLSPDLVFTAYAQPFISSGSYDQIGELADPDTGFVRWYGNQFHTGATRTIVDGPNAFSVDEPDYSIASLRSTAVLRWEFRPGSTLYIAWQQQRGGIPIYVAQPLHSTLGDAFTQSAIHTLALKLSYWFG
ncbi:MAG: DUF5916 domain-containing protein [Kofleriaceae bacterium]